MGSYFCASEVEQMFVETLKAHVKSANTNGSSFLLLLSIYPGIAGRLDDGYILEFCFILCDF